MTVRESQIYTLMVEGLCNKEIGRRLGISERTVKNHLKAIYRMTGTKTRLQCAVKHYKEGKANETVHRIVR